MSLALLRLRDFRAIRSAELVLHPRLNLITGANGSGKTTVLEGIYLLGRGRSFRNRHTEHLIRHGERQFWLHGRTAPEPGHLIGIECHVDTGLKARIDERAASSLAELSQAFPVQIIEPGIHRLVEDGPTQRRRWVDWAVFHVEPQFVGSWQVYMRSLKQRNAALKAGGDPKLWEVELVRQGNVLTSARRRLSRRARTAPANQTASILMLISRNRAECVSAPTEIRSAPASAIARTVSSVTPPETSS